MIAGAWREFGNAGAGATLTTYEGTVAGKEGKFWFAVQPSDDPRTVYHMGEIEPDDEWDEESGYSDSYTDYESADAEKIKKHLDEQYDILGVPKEERKYRCENEGEYVWEDLAKYYLTEKEPPKDAMGHMACGYYMGDDKPTMYPISSEKELAASRVQLGLVIYNTILTEGICMLNAEN